MRSPDTGAGGKLVLSNISEVSWEDQIDDGDDVTERAFGGRKCYTDKGQPEISSVNLSLTSWHQPGPRQLPDGFDALHQRR